MPELSPTAADELEHPEEITPEAEQPEAEPDQLEVEADPETEEPPAPAAPNAVAEALRAARVKEVASRGQPEQARATTVVSKPAAPARPAAAPAAEIEQPEQPEVEQPAVPHGAAPKTFDELMSGLDANGRDLVERHIAGLKAALSQERDASKKLEKQLRTTQATAEEVAPLRSQLTQAQTDAQVAKTRADFYERAVAEGVKRGNARLVFLAASDGGFIDADGSVRWADLREKFSDLFEPTTPVAPTRPTPRASVGAGLTQPATGGTRGLNQILREAAGRRS